jgi:hypothetical protein
MKSLTTKDTKDSTKDTKERRKARKDANLSLRNSAVLRLSSA